MASSPACELAFPFRCNTERPLPTLLDNLTDSPSLFLFCFQALLFYVPRWLWKNWEAGKITALKMDLDLGIISEAERRQKKKMLIDYLHGNLKNHNFWAYRYFFCEVLSLLNLFGETLS